MQNKLDLPGIEPAADQPAAADAPYSGGRPDYAQRQAARRERLENASDRQAREASQRFKRARSAVDGIPFGQPILVGHHSERRHRGALEKHDTNMRAGIDAQERARELAGRAASVGTAGVSSDDPEALQKLRKEFADLDKIQAQMKSANAAIRQQKNPEACVVALCEIIPGLKPAGASRLMQPDDCGRIGFADYQLQNNNANMRRILKRIEALQTMATIPEGERARSNSGVVFQVADNRVQLLFPGKPSEFIRDHLKSKGFRWARSAGAWQRHLNAGGINVAGDVIEWLDKLDIQEGR